MDLLHQAQSNRPNLKGVILCWRGRRGVMAHRTLPLWRDQPSYAGLRKQHRGNWKAGTPFKLKLALQCCLVRPQLNAPHRRQLEAEP
jgi:hypothetical protein